MRHASMTMSWLADRKATSTASATVAVAPPRGSVSAMAPIASHQPELDRQQPAAPPSEEGRPDGIERRRPEELVRVGQPDQRGQPELAERHAGFHEPLPQHLPRHQRQRHAGGEAEGKQDQQAAVA
jgi:hypothetical protein